MSPCQAEPLGGRVMSPCQAEPLGGRVLSRMIVGPLESPAFESDRAMRATRPRSVRGARRTRRTLASSSPRPTGLDGAVRRAGLLWLVLFAAYASTLGTPARTGSEYGPAEAGYLRTAASVAEHGRLGPREAHGIGFPILLVPAYAAGGEKAAELFCAALAALAFVLAAALARRLVPEPWATAGPLVAGLSLPALGYAAAVMPELSAGALLAGAALLALALRERPRIAMGAALGLCVALLPWLGVAFLPAGLLIGAVAARWLVVRRAGLAALIGAEVVFTSLVVFVEIDDKLFGGPTPYSALAGGAGDATGAGSLGAHAARAYRLVALLIDRDYGLLRWAPFLALALFAAWLLWRAWRENLGRAVPEHREAQAAGGLLAGACAAQLAVAAFLAPTMYGEWFPGRQLIAVLPLAAALCAWGLRHAPRVGAVLAAVTIAASVWFTAELRLDDAAGWTRPAHSSAPLGPAERALPSFR
jgi:hypothetical protein